MSKAKELANRIVVLEELIVHCWLHSGYQDCGFKQMTTEQQVLYTGIYCRADEILGSRFNEIVKSLKQRKDKNV